jgi:predicted naringenin-chalcone synthase
VCVHEPANEPFCLGDEAHALGEPLVAEAQQVTIVVSDRHLPEHASHVDALANTHQGRAKRAVPVGEPHEQDVPKPHHAAAEGPCRADAEPMALAGQRVEPGAQRPGVIADREQRSRRGHVAEPPGEASPDGGDRVFALRELPAQLRTESREPIHAPDGCDVRAANDGARARHAERRCHDDLDNVANARAHPDHRAGAERAAAPRPMASALTRFEATPPPYVIAQAQSLAWLAAVHAEAEASRRDLGEPERAAFAAQLARVIDRCACGPDQLAARGHSVADVARDAWDDHTLYDVRRHPHGRGTATRMQRFREIVEPYFVAAYAGEAAPPDDLVHVTCTGYVSPSAAQQLVARRGWTSRVIHAYHMGCYAALPAIRIAGGLVALGSRRVDVVHTELCSLHLDPCDHRTEQLVVQSLFADGLIRYAVVDAATCRDAPALRIDALHEQVLPDSADAMRWVVADHGMAMTLARDVPARIATALRGFVIELVRRTGRGLGCLREAVFAVHPGGPRIIDAVRDVLELDDAQVAASRAVLRDHGNMSSATLPHIWMRLLADPTVAPGTTIASLAFGPGLTICGALLEKR